MRSCIEPANAFEMAYYHTWKAAQNEDARRRGTHPARSVTADAAESWWPVVARAPALIPRDDTTDGPHDRQEACPHASGARRSEWCARALGRVQTVDVRADGGPPWLRSWQAFTDMDECPASVPRAARA